MDDELRWFVATRRDSKAHCVFNENYLNDYHREFERVREFKSAEEAVAAYEARCEADLTEVQRKSRRGKIAAAKIRGDIKEGSMEDEALRAQLKAELKAELEAELALTTDDGSATTGPKTRARSKAKTTPKE